VKNINQVEVLKVGMINLNHQAQIPSHLTLMYLPKRFEGTQVDPPLQSVDVDGSHSCFKPVDGFR